MKLEKKRKPVNYIDNKKFYDAIVEYRERYDKAKAEGKELPRIPEYIGKCLWQIGEGLATKSRWNKYTYKDEMIADGVEVCIRYFHSFDPKVGKNPFAYFTQTMKYAFMNRAAIEEENRYAICKNFQNTILLGGRGGSMGNDSTHDILQSFEDGDKIILSKDVYDNINEFMHSFEEREKAKKAKRKAKAKAFELLIEEDENV